VYRFQTKAGQPFPGNAETVFDGSLFLTGWWAREEGHFSDNRQEGISGYRLCHSR
jgi:hypothetical protein